MIRHSRGPITYLCFDNLQKQPKLCHFVSTRNGGCSTGKFGTLNLSIKLEPNPKCAIENRRRLFKAVGLTMNKMTVGSQTHSCNVATIEKQMVGLGAEDFQSALPDTDALITSLPDVAIAVLVADCTPILLFDPRRRAIGVIHAGRMGTIHGVAKRTVEEMVAKFSTNPADLIVGIGPSICPRHYLVSDDAQQQIRAARNETFLVHMPDGALSFDLWAANIAQFINAGVTPENIELSQLCTYENAELFFSERRDGKPTGRFCVGICMNA